MSEWSANRIVPLLGKRTGKRGEKSENVSERNSVAMPSAAW
jgi:hypothetical protein